MWSAARFDTWTACFVYKSINSLLPHCFANFFESNDTVHDYNLRNNRNIKLHQSTNKVFSLKYNGPRIWNDIDISIRGARHVDIFKAKLKQHYLESYISQLHVLHFVFVIFNLLLIPF